MSRPHRTRIESLETENDSDDTRLNTLEDDYWDDLRFPATAINPPGALSDPDFDTTNGGYLFDAGSTETLFLLAQLPHTYKIGSDLEPHVHWQKTTSASGNILWQLDYKIALIGEVMDAEFTTLSSAVAAVSDDDTANKHALTDLGTISGETLNISSMILMKLSRIGGDALDTYGADVRLLEFDIHYINDSRGSSQEFIK